MRILKTWGLLTAALALALAHNAAAQAASQFESGPEPVALLELYTSEGCSSCPPADRWLSSLRDRQDLWERYVPVAFHVDYWNYLGWPDRFARPAFSARQRQYRAQGHTRGVYTPGLMLGGQEWRSWRRGGLPGPVSMDKVGSLTLDLDGQRFRAGFEPGADARLQEPTFTIAVLGMGIGSDVRAGENRGRALRHDFVVLAQRSYPASSASSLSWTGKLPQAPLAQEAARLAVAAWVSDGTDLRPVQAVGGWLAADTLAVAATQ